MCKNNCAKFAKILVARNEPQNSSGLKTCKNYLWLETRRPSLHNLLERNVPGSAAIPPLAGGTDEAGAGSTLASARRPRASFAAACWESPSLCPGAPMARIPQQRPIGPIPEAATVCPASLQQVGAGEACLQGGGRCHRCGRRKSRWAVACWWAGS